ncbi:MAG: hypothetical protein QM813_01295 [Verrucomicrobiota bacterium]
MEGGEEGLGILLKPPMRWVIEAFLVCGESRADIAPVGALREIDHKVDVLILPAIQNEMMFVLRFERLDLESVGVWAIRGNQIDRVSGIQQWGKNLPTGVHQPSGCEQFKGVVFVQSGIGI